jgi:TRAP-type C4-dicarboxylate transport system substrate-binding protein
MKAKRRVVSSVAIAGLAALVAAACGGSDDGSGTDEAVELIVSSHRTPDNNAQGLLLQWWVDEVEKRSDGQLSFEIFWSGALSPSQEIMPSISECRADVGNFATAYHPEAFPLTLVSGIPFVTENMPAQMAAFNELYETNDAMRSEFEEQGQRLLSSIGTPPPVMGANEPIKSLDWISGKKIRTVLFLTEAVDAIGGNPAAIPSSEMYEAMQRGVVDAFYGVPLDAVPGAKLHEVAPHVTDTGTGNYSTAELTISTAAFDSLSEDLQEVILEVSSEIPAKMAELTDEAEDSACDILLDAGGGAYELPEADVKEWQDTIGDSINDVWLERAERLHGRETAEQFYDEYIATLEKYEEEFSDYTSGIGRCVDKTAAG